MRAPPDHFATDGARPLTARFDLRVVPSEFLARATGSRLQLSACGGHFTPGFDLGQLAKISKMVPVIVPRMVAPLRAQEVRVLPDERVDALSGARLRTEDVKRCAELEDKELARREPEGERHDVCAGLEGKLSKPGGEPALAPEELHRARVVEIHACIGQVTGYSSAGKQVFCGVHLSRELELLRRRRSKTSFLELLFREADFENVVSSMAKVRLEQAGKLAVHRKEDQSRRVSPASVEMLPSRHSRESRDEFGRPTLRSSKHQARQSLPSKLRLTNLRVAADDSPKTVAK